MKRIKTKSAVLLFVIVMIAPAFSSCKKDSINDITGAEKWECIIYNKTKITMYLYKAENKFYTTVSGDITGVLFGHNVLSYYQMTKDTMRITKEVYNYDTFSYPIGDGGPFWIIKKPSLSIMNMQHYGFYPCVGVPRITEYQFNLKKIK